MDENEDEVEDEEMDEEDDEADGFSRPFQRATPAVLTSKPPAQRPAARAATPPTKRMAGIDRMAAEFENADIDKELSDPKELGEVPVDEVDVLGMGYEFLKFVDTTSTNYVLGCRRINNHILRGERAPAFNQKFTFFKHIIRGSGVLVKAVHSFPWFRRGINLPLTKVASKRMGVVSGKAVDDFYKIYAQWREAFMMPLMAKVPEHQHMVALQDRGFVDELLKVSTQWMMDTYQAGEDQVEPMTKVAWKYYQLYYEELTASRTPLYEAFEPQYIDRPRATPEDIERERIAKGINLPGTFDDGKDLFTRPNKKRRR